MHKPDLNESWMNSVNATGLAFYLYITKDIEMEKYVIDG